MAAAPAQHYGRGIALSCGGFTAWAFCDALIKLASETLTSSTVMFIGVLCGCLTTVSLAHRDGGLRQIKTRRIGFHFCRAVLCLISFYTCIVALKHLPLASFYMVVFISPLLIALLEKIWLKERTPWPVWTAILFGFAGILVAAQTMRQESPGNAETDLLGVGLAFACASVYSLVAILTRAARDENNYALSIWPDCLIIPTAAGLMLWEGVGAVTATGVLWAMLSGVLNGLGFLMTNASLRVAPAAIVSPYHYTQIVTGALLGYLIWGNIPGWGVVIGAGMVIASGFYILHHSRAQTARDFTHSATSA